MLLVETSGPVVYARLNRPDVLNALNDELISLLTDLFVSPPPGTRVIVLSGEGPSFCAGGDLQWMKKAAAYTEEENFEDAKKVARLFESITTCPAVVIARVHGFAFGGGGGLVAAADVAVAADNAKFCFSEVRLGLVAATISTFVVPKIGPGHTRCLFTTAEAFDAARAERIGLVHDVAPLDQLDALVEEKIKYILKNGPEAVYASKMIAQDYPLPLEETARRLAAARSGEEGKEGVAAFLEKRKANFVVDR